MKTSPLPVTLARLLRGPDPIYDAVLTRHPHWSWSKTRARHYRHLAYFKAHLDSRTPQERERAQFGKWYPFLVAARAEDSNTTRAAKLQSKLQHIKRKT